MFWIGFGAGAGAAFVVGMAVVAAFSLAVMKGKKTGMNMDTYWKDLLEVQNRNADTFESIESLLICRK